MPFYLVNPERARATARAIGFPGFLASGVLLVWNPSQRKAAMPQAALCSVAPAMAESVFPVLSGAGDPESGR